jgi:hypothetical protein
MTVASAVRASVSGFRELIKTNNKNKNKNKFQNN